MFTSYRTFISTTQITWLRYFCFTKKFLYLPMNSSFCVNLQATIGRLVVLSCPHVDWLSFLRVSITHTLYRRQWLVKLVSELHFRWLQLIILTWTIPISDCYIKLTLLSGKSCIYITIYTRYIRVYIRDFQNRRTLRTQVIKTSYSNTSFHTPTSENIE